MKEQPLLCVRTQICVFHTKGVLQVFASWGENVCLGDCIEERREQHEHVGVVNLPEPRNPRAVT